MLLQKLSKRQIQATAMRYYNNNLLCAQHGIADVFIRGEYRCPIATVFSKQTIKLLVSMRRDLPLNHCVRYTKKLAAWLIAVGEAHDKWATGEANDKPLLALLTEDKR